MEVRSNESARSGETFPPTPHCPYFQATVELIGRRWTASIIRSLFVGEQRFSDVFETIPGISARLLTKRLRELCASGLVTSRHDGHLGSYALTERGRDLREVLVAVEEWNRRWAWLR